MHTCLRVLLILISLSFFTSLASAATVSQTLEFTNKESKSRDSEEYSVSFDRTKKQTFRNIENFDISLGALDRVSIDIAYDAESSLGAKFVDYGRFTTISGDVVVELFETYVSVGGQGVGGSIDFRSFCLDPLPKKNNSCSQEISKGIFYELNDAYVRDEEMDSFIDGTAELTVFLAVDAEIYSGRLGDLHIIEDAEFFAQAKGSATITYHYTPNPPSPVPVPAAAWLFGSALTGLGWVRRKQTS